MDRLEKRFPPIAQQESPVVALAVLETNLLPARVAKFPEGHVPALRVAPAEGVDVDKEHGVQAAVAHLADAHGHADHHVDEVHAVLVALECEGHALAPPGIEEGVEADLVADEGGVHVEARVHLLQQVLQLQVLEVQVGLEADKLLTPLRVHVLWFAAASVQLVALVAGAAERDVGQAAHGAAVVASYDAGDGALAQRGAAVAHAAPLALQERSPKPILVAVEKRLDPGKPLLDCPGGQKENGDC